MLPDNRMLEVSASKTYAATMMAVVALLQGCGQAPPQTAEEPAHSAVPTFFDRNGDGRVDQEKRHMPGVADGDSELRDDDYDGRYEKHILYGIAMKETKVDIRVPQGVKIEETP